MKRQDLTGMRFGRLQVLQYEGKCRWKCLCDCGKIVYPLAGNLVKGDIKSCGCLRKEITSAHHKIHGESKTRLCRIWKAMRKRCRNPHDKCYEQYGGRGIDYVPEWDNYLIFKEWALANGYQDHLTIERKNVNEGYSPQNCCWKTLKEQSRNKQNTVYCEVNGVIKPLIEWCEIYNTNYATASHRIKHQHLSGEKIFETTKQRCQNLASKSAEIA